MNRRYYFVAFAVLLSVGVILGLQVNGYLFSDQRMIPPVSSVELKEILGEITGGNASGSGTPPLLNLTDQLKDVPGIKNIKYSIFVSTASKDQVLAHYTDVLGGEGYSYHSEYSGRQTYRSAEIFYYAFVKGLNGVVIFLSEYNSHTWVCYTTGGVLQYQQIFEYLTSHGILR